MQCYLGKHFKVDHFSKYGFNDSDDELEQNGPDVTKKGDQEPKIKPGEVKKPAPKVATKESLEEPPQDLTSDPCTGTFRLDKEILIEDDDEQEENDLLHQSFMMDDGSEDDFQVMPPPMHYRPYTKNVDPTHVSIRQFNNVIYSLFTVFLELHYSWNFDILLPVYF